MGGTCNFLGQILQYTQYVILLLRNYAIYRKDIWRKKEKVGSSTISLRFGIGTGFENTITPAAACLHLYQSSNRFCFIPLEAIETYIHCLESFSTQLVQSQRTSIQAHQVPEFGTPLFISDLSSHMTNAAASVIAETLNTSHSIRTSGENVNIVSHDFDSRISSIPENAVDENDSQLLSIDKPKKLLQDYFLDEDSLLENLPKFEQCNGSDLPCELTRNLNWLQSKSPSAKSDFEICNSDGYVSRQKKQILQAKNHRNINISTRGINEGKSGGSSCTSNLPPISTYHQSNNNNWRKFSQNAPLSKNNSAHVFSISDNFVRSRERNNCDKRSSYLLQSSRKIQPQMNRSDIRFYTRNMDQNHGCSQYSSSDRHFSPKITNVYRSANRSSLISHDKNGLNYHDGNAKNSFNLVISNDKRTHGTPDYLVHRSVKRNGPNRSRNSPPVRLALKSHREFVDIDSTEVELISNMTKEERLDQSYGSQQTVENTRKTTQNVEQLTGLFCEHVAVCEGSYFYLFLFEYLIR
ncbi:unnamed protein product [Onchocerca flexuosa]|uniref:Uncharacterized protein n=1 Tax=Onchocerca flexuosa TaxID=387005 RepID=A0A183H2B8_9BILA|nr:unnamed protein product [Onchocerca flexuosa]